MTTDQKPSLFAFLIVGVAPLCWAGNIVLGKGVSGLIPPVALAFWRWAVAFLILLPLTWPYVKRDWRTARAGWKIICLLAFFGVTTFNTLLYLSVHTTTAINVALIQTTMPAAIIIISLILYDERISRLQSLGVACCMAGAGIVVIKGSVTALVQMKLVQGDMLMLLAVVLYAMYSALLPKRPNIHPFSFLTYTFGVGCLGLLPVYVWEILTIGSFAITPKTLGSIAYVAVFPSIVAYFCWNRGVAVIGANRTGLFINLIPIFTAVLAILLLGETLKTYHLAGMGLILLGFTLFNR